MRPQHRLLLVRLVPLRRGYYCCSWQCVSYNNCGSKHQHLSSTTSSSSSNSTALGCLRLAQVALNNTQHFHQRTASYYNGTIPYNSSSSHPSATSSTDSSGLNEKDRLEIERQHSSNHELFEKQLLELKQEREAMLGLLTEDERANDGNNNTEQRFDFDFQQNVQDTKVMSTHITKDQGMLQMEDQLLEMKLEREALFGFTEEERANWSSVLSRTTMLQTITKEPVDSSSAVESKNDNGDVMQWRAEGAYNNSTVSTPLASHDHHHHAFTHLDVKGNSVKMVDVGSKVPTHRYAKARTRVLLPPEVMVAFSISQEGDLVGPKGPIFSTAKIAGIMASKRTFEIIPLCHAVSLDKCHIEITLHRNEIIIECECSVTNHKTGVEMEALVGASVAALTIYDMVKAVSHRVRIDSTELIQKTGGKRDFLIN
jgi:cyclic pyranopterin phosphate synthase